MLNRHNLNIAALCAKEESRFTLNGILVTPECTVETDGHQLVKVTRPKQHPAAAFPELPGARPAVDMHRPFMLPATDALQISKALPKKQTIPILENAAVTAETDEGDVAGILVTDLQNHRVFRPTKLKGTFPEYERVIPKPENFTHRIAVNAALLRKILQQVEAFQPDARLPVCRMYFQNENSAIRIDADGGDGQHLTAVVMPVRADFVEMPAETQQAAEPVPTEQQQPIEPIAQTASVDSDHTETSTDPFDVQMANAADAKAGRTIIRAHEDAINSVERQLGFNPIVGEGGSGFSFRGFSTVKPAEWRPVLKAAKAANKELAFKLQILIDQGVRMETPWKKLLAVEHAAWNKPAESDEPEETPAIEEPVSPVFQRMQQTCDEKRARRQAAAQKAWATMRARKAAAAGA